MTSITLYFHHAPTSVVIPLQTTFVQFSTLINNSLDKNIKIKSLLWVDEENDTLMINSDESLKEFLSASRDHIIHINRVHKNLKNQLTPEIKLQLDGLEKKIKSCNSRIIQLRQSVVVENLKSRAYRNQTRLIKRKFATERKHPELFLHQSKINMPLVEQMVSCLYSDQALVSPLFFSESLSKLCEYLKGVLEYEVNDVKLEDNDDDDDDDDDDNSANNSVDSKLDESSESSEKLPSSTSSELQLGHVNQNILIVSDYLRTHCPSCVLSIQLALIQSLNSSQPLPIVQDWLQQLCRLKSRFLQKNRRQKAKNINKLQKNNRFNKFNRERGPFRGKNNPRGRFRRPHHYGRRHQWRQNKNNS